MNELEMERAYLESQRENEEKQEAYRQFCEEMHYRGELTEGIPLDRLREMCAAERDGRCVVLPTNFETAEPNEFYQVRFCPTICNEDHCEYCGFGKDPDNCSFKPYVAKLPRRRVYDAYCDIINLHATRPEAEAALAKEGGQEE